MSAGSNLSFLLGGDDPPHTLTPSEKEGTFSDAVQHHAMQQQSRLFLDSTHQREVDFTAPAFVPPSFKSSVPSINLSFQDTPAPASRLGSFFKIKAKSPKTSKSSPSQTVMGAEAQLGSNAAPIEVRPSSRLSLSLELTASFAGSHRRVLCDVRKGPHVPS